MRSPLFGDRCTPAAEGRLTLKAAASRMAISMETSTAAASPQTGLQSNACIARGVRSCFAVSSQTRQHTPLGRENCLHKHWMGKWQGYGRTLLWAWSTRIKFQLLLPVCSEIGFSLIL